MMLSYYTLLVIFPNFVKALQKRSAFLLFMNQKKPEKGKF